MIEILSLDDRDREKLCRSCGITEASGLLAKGAYEDGRLLGNCLYKCKSDAAELVYADDLPPPVLDGLVRAVLFACIQKGVKTAHFTPRCQLDKLFSLGILSSLDNLTINLTNFFSQCKKC